MPDADLGSHRLHYVRRGTGAPLLLIQGMAGHHRMWGEPFLGHLTDDFDVLAYDHRGIGESTDVPGQFTIADLAEDAAALLDALGWSDAHVMGISMGGMVAQELALRHPERVRTAGARLHLDLRAQRVGADHGLPGRARQRDRANDRTPLRRA